MFGELLEVVVFRRPWGPSRWRRRLRRVLWCSGKILHPAPLGQRRDRSQESAFTCISCCICQVGITRHATRLLLDDALGARRQRRAACHPRHAKERRIDVIDVVDQRTRSRMMAGIKGRNTSPELVVRRYLHAAGLRFRVHNRALPGSPDVVLPKYRVVVFVHGCFWHRHADCRYATTPASRFDFWQEKFASNVLRDQRNALALEAQGWEVLTVWECELRDPAALDALFWRIVAAEPLSR